MKIAFLAYDKPGYHGGPIVNVRRLLPELVKRGHVIHAMILYHKDYSPASEYLSQNGVVVHVQAWQKYTEDNIHWIINTLKVIQPDVFVPNLSVAGWYASRWIRESGIPTIAAMRSSDVYHWAMVDEFVSGKKEWAVSGLVCVSRLLLNQIDERDHNYTKLKFIPSGVPLPIETADHDHSPLKIAYVGRLVNEAKRIFETIDALSRILEILPDCTVTLFGQASDSEMQEKIDRKILSTGHNKRIKCAGSVPPDELHSYLKNYHILVLLSDYEGTPGGVMDGMACGLVPVCLDIPGGIRELVIHEETGLLVKNRDEDFIKNILILEKNIEFRRYLARNARRHIEMTYSLHLAVIKWESLFINLLNDVDETGDIFYPGEIVLPPVHKDLRREDRRYPSFLRKKINDVISIVMRK